MSERHEQYWITYVGLGIVSLEGVGTLGRHGSACVNRGIAEALLTDPTWEVRDSSGNKLERKEDLDGGGVERPQQAEEAARKAAEEAERARQQKEAQEAARKAAAEAKATPPIDSESAAPAEDEAEADAEEKGEAGHDEKEEGERGKKARGRGKRKGDSQAKKQGEPDAAEGVHPEMSAAKPSGGHVSAGEEG